MNNFTPSIVPDASDQTVYMVLDDLGYLGRIWPEADEEGTDREMVIIDLLAGQYRDPVRVIAFNTAERWSQDVSQEIADELRRRCDQQMSELPLSISDFVERYESNDRRQLTLRFA